MLAVVKRLVTGKDNDAAALQQQIQQLKTEGAEASAEIERLRRERAAAASFDQAKDLDDRIARQVWVTEHLAAELPQLEERLATAQAVAKAADWLAIRRC